MLRPPAFLSAAASSRSLNSATASASCSALSRDRRGRSSATSTPTGRPPPNRFDPSLTAPRSIALHRQSCSLHGPTHRPSIQCALRGAFRTSPARSPGQRCGARSDRHTPHWQPNQGHPPEGLPRILKARVCATVRIHHQGPPRAGARHAQSEAPWTNARKRHRKSQREVELSHNGHSTVTASSATPPSTSSDLDIRSLMSASTTGSFHDARVYPLHSPERTLQDPYLSTFGHLATRPIRAARATSHLTVVVPAR